MAERWQQWMPFHIDKFRGSPEVQAMHPAARCGYLYLLASMWQSADCTISADTLDLATESGLGDELWATYAPRILRKFEIIDGRLRNLVLFAEWSEALRVYEKRKTGAVRTNSSRSASAVRTQSERPADTQTLTGTVTTTEVLKPLASTANAVPADKGKLLGTLPLNDGSEWEVYSVYVESLVPLYSAVDVRQELRSMKGWLIGNPKFRKTRGGIKRFISAWLEKEQDKARPGGLGNGANHRVPESKWEAARKRILEEPEMDQGEADDDGRATRGPDTLAGRPDSLSVSAEWLF